MVTVRGNHVPKKLQIGPSEMALLWGASESVSVEPLEDESDVADVAVPVARVDDDVIKVRHAEFAPVTCQDVAHQVLEGSGCILEAEWHHPELILSARGCREGGLFLCVGCHGYLPVPALEIQGGEYFGLS